MIPSSFPNRLWRGVTSHPWKSMVSVYIAFAALWTPTEAIIAFANGPGPDGALKFTVLVAVALALGLGRMAIPRNTTIVIAGTKTSVRVQVADIFSFEGHRVIPVNEFFDCALGDHVANTSLHGQCVSRLFGGDSARFASAVDGALAGVGHESVARPSGRTKRYPLGTTAVVEHGEHKLFLTALSRTNPTTLKAFADLHDLVAAWLGAWRAVRTHSNGQAVSVPLMGAGQSAVPATVSELLEIALITLGHEARRTDVTQQITLCLAEQAFASIDLSTLSAKR